MKRVWTEICGLVVVVCLVGCTAGCLHEDSCSFSNDGLDFSGGCSFNLDDVIDGIEDRLSD